MKRVVHRVRRQLECSVAYRFWREALSIGALERNPRTAERLVNVTAGGNLVARDRLIVTMLQRQPGAHKL